MNPNLSRTLIEIAIFITVGEGSHLGQAASLPPSLSPLLSSSLALLPSSFLPPPTIAGQKFLIKKNDSLAEEGEISGFLHHYDRD